MAQNDPLSSASASRKNTLVYEVHLSDELDFMEHVFYIF